MNPRRRSQVILVVEDDADLRQLIRTALLFKGFDVKEASDGYYALCMLEQAEVALMVLDLKMPHIDGIGVLQELQGRNRLPIVVVTGTDADVSRFDVDCVLRKPVNAGLLIEIVKRCLAKWANAS